MKIKHVLFIMLFMSITLLLVACGGENEGDKTLKTVQLASNNYTTVSEDDFNRDLFYMNTLEFQVADPTVIYAEHGEGAGYFYAFGTSDLIGCHGIQCWRSLDLANWEYTGVALLPDPSSTWAENNYWAPEIIYDDQYQLYFLFYNAEDVDTGLFHLSVAYSENVMGPYIIPNNLPNQNGDVLVNTKPVINFLENQSKLPENIDVRNKAIDACPFIDPVTGKRYLYWSWWTDGVYRQELFAMEMKDWFSPDYSTVVQVTRVNRKTVDGEETIDEANTLNEGPFMIYKDGTYMLTYSVYGYTDPNYQVRIATSDNPLTGFEKIDPMDGGTVISTLPTWRHIVSSGHHCFVKAGEKTYIVYHTFYDRASIQYGRSLAADEVEFVTNSEGKLTIHSNGPTYSLQPIPTVVSGYDNVASQAKVTATNVSSRSNIDYLTDNLIKMKDFDVAKETEFNGPTKITFEFEKPVNLKAIMVYNSCDYDRSFVQIDSIELTYVGDEKGNTGIAKIDTVKFDFDFYSQNYKSMKPGAAAISEFEEVPVTKVTLNINFDSFNISEIKLLANVKEEATYKSEFENAYEYNNVIDINNYVPNGTTLGSNEVFEATYGWDFSNDKGTSDSYVVNKGLAEAYAYYKDLNSTKFYVEAYLGTYSTKPFAKDPYPKLGLVVKTEDSSVFFYIDAAGGYTNKYVGYTQSKFGSPNEWDWGGTEQIRPFGFNDYSNKNLNLNGNFAKMAILRDGAVLYLFVDDKLAFTVTDIRGMDETVLTNVGILCFNTPLCVKGYSSITDSSLVDAKLAELKK